MRKGEHAMKASKILSLVLAGVMAVAMFSGCTKEIIEYQIYTETVSGGSTGSGGNTGAGGSGGSGTAGNTITAQEAFKRLSELMESHGITLYITYIAMFSGATLASIGADYDTVTLDRLSEWAKAPASNFYIYTKLEERPESYSEYLALGAVQANMLYETFLLFSDAEWENLEKTIQEQGRTLGLRVQCVQNYTDQVYYIETNLTTG